MQVMLGGPIGPKLQSLLDEKIVIPTSLKEEVDEYHLILEYGVGEVWGDHTSACGNRFIISHDIRNGHMTAMDKFFGKHILSSIQSTEILNLQLKTLMQVNPLPWAEKSDILLPEPPSLPC